MKIASTYSIVLWVLFVLSVQNVLAQKVADSFYFGETITITTPFADQSEFMHWYYDSVFYEEARLTDKYECIQVFYKSDTAMVEAWLYRPKKIEPNHKFPLIIYNRGGMGNFGNLEETNLVDFYNMALHGYLVIATKSRFSGNMGKYDEHGGIDVNDIVNLNHVYHQLNYVDTNNIFMYGFSRGGQNTYQASLKMKINAMVVTAGTTDWVSRINERREFVDGWTDQDSTLNYLGFAKVFPNWNTDSVAILRDRSAIYWADQITVPVLILHSRHDQKVPCCNALKMAEQLQQLNKDYALIIYDEPSHSLPFSQFDSYDQMFKWFEKHKVYE
jgi:dipeptidyl aminopeptidase/acylaminoacyl peptidase